MEDGEQNYSKNKSKLELLAKNQIITDYTTFQEFMKIFGEQPFIAVAIEQDGVFKYVNDVFANIAEYSIQDMLNWTLEERMHTIHPHDLKIISDRRKKREEGIEIVPYVFFRIISKSGEFKWIEAYSKDIKYEGKKALLSFIIDVTEKKESENSIRESEQKFRSMAEESLFGIVLLQDGLLKFANKSAAEICEYSVKEMMDWSVNEFLYKIHPDERLYIMNRMQKILEGDSTIDPHSNFRIITKSGKEKLVKGHSKLLTIQGKLSIFATLVELKDKN